MCLYSKENKLKAADQDIVCYKLVDKMEGVGYKSPVMGFHIPQGVINGKLPYIAEQSSKDNENDYTCSIGNLFQFGPGLIHTFKHQPKEIRYYGEGSQVNAKLFECIIPKGTKYVEGVDTSMYESYASEKIFFKRKTKFEKEKHHKQPYSIDINDVEYK